MKVNDDDLAKAAQVFARIGERGYVWKRHSLSPGFNLQKEIEKQTLPMLEIGGPTKRGICDIRPWRAKGKTVFVSNLFPQNHKIGEDCHILLDLRTDGQLLPVRDSSLSVVFASCMIRDVRPLIIKEASRVLAPGGLLVWNGFQMGDHLQAQKCGLGIIQYFWKMYGISHFGIRTPIDLEPRGLTIEEISMRLPTHSETYSGVPNLSQKKKFDQEPDYMIFRKP